MNKPILLVGLGNPEAKYKNTRHNVGFDILEKIDTGDFKQDPKFEAEILNISDKITLLKPQTYMNLSGKAVSKYANFYKIPSENIWVIHDDIDLPLGTIRTRLGGSSGGHKGIQSIIDSLGTEDFYRFRIGIHNDKANEIGTERFVLTKFTSVEKGMISMSIEECLTVLKESFKTGVPKKITIKKN